MSTLLFPVDESKQISSGGKPVCEGTVLTPVTELDLKARKGFWNGFCAQPRPSHVSSLGSQLGAGLVGFSVDPVSAIKE